MRQHAEDIEDEAPPSTVRGERLGPCGLCGRSMIAGPSVNRHHLKPRMYGGREAVWMHRICHHKIHSLFDEKALEDHYHTFEALLAHEEIARFVRWVRKKDPEFYSRNAPKRR